MPTWYDRDIAEVMSALSTSMEGLDPAEAARRLKQYGPNQLEERRGRSPWLIFLSQFTDIMVIVLLAAAALVDPVHVLRRVLQPRPRTSLQRLSAEYLSFYQGLLRRHGLTPSPALTPQEAMRAGVEALAGRGLAPEALLGFNERFYNLRYAAEAPEADVEALRRELQSLRRQMRRR